MGIGRLRERAFVRYVVVAACVLLVFSGLLIVSTHVYAHVVRRRAEALLEEMQGLTVGSSTWNDLQGIRARWGEWGSSDGKCDEKICNYYVEVGIRFGHPLLTRILLYGGHSHIPSASLYVHVENGLVQGASYSLDVYVPKGYGPRWEAEAVKKYQMVPYSTSDDGYMLVARAREQSGLSEYDHRLQDYVLTRPGGCLGCLAIWAVYTPHISKMDKERMLGFNFSCMTRWRPCKDEEDIMPEAGKEYEAQGGRW